MKKILFSILIFILILSNFALYSNAAEATITYSVSTSNITVGSEFDSVLSVTQLGAFSEGINAMDGFLSYDDCLELVSVTAANPNLFENPSFNSKNNKFSILTKEMNLVQAGPVLKIRFKLKTRPESTTKVATLSRVSLTDGTDELSFSDVSITLTVKDQKPENTTPVTNTTGNTTPVNNTAGNTTLVNNTSGNTTPANNTSGNTTPANNTSGNTPSGSTNSPVSNKNTNIKNTSIANSSKDPSASTKKIPYTGFSSFIIICISCILIAGCISYYRYKKLKLH